MTKKEHNGWYNYETWAVNVWLTNDEATEQEWNERAVQALIEATKNPDDGFTPKESATNALTEPLREFHEEQLPKGEGFAADLLGAALSEVNWHELAQHLVDNVGNVCRVCHEVEEAAEEGDSICASCKAHEFER